MIDDLREEEIVNKVGGRFKLSTLIQKRLVALNAGSRPLVDVTTDDPVSPTLRGVVRARCLTQRNSGHGKRCDEDNCNVDISGHGVSLSSFAVCASV